MHIVDLHGHEPTLSPWPMAILHGYSEMCNGFLLNNSTMVGAFALQEVWKVDNILTGWHLHIMKSSMEWPLTNWDHLWGGWTSTDKESSRGETYNQGPSMGWHLWIMISSREWHPQIRGLSMGWPYTLQTMGSSLAWHLHTTSSSMGWHLQTLWSSMGWYL